jgi:hypothetical protein
MGIAVFWGMVGVTSFGIFLTPVFYVLLRSLSGGKLWMPKVPQGSVGLGAPALEMQPQGRKDD